MSDWKDLSLNFGKPAAAASPEDAPARTGENSPPSSSDLGFFERAPVGDVKLTPDDNAAFERIVAPPEHDQPAKAGNPRLPARIRPTDEEKSIPLHALFGSSSADTGTTAARRPASRVTPTHTAPPTTKGATGAAAAPAVLSDDQFLDSLHTDNIAPLVGMAVGFTSLLLLANGLVGAHGGGVTVGAFAAVASGLTLLVAVGLSFVVAKLVAMMFHADFGTFKELFLKVTAMCAAYDLVMLGVGMVAGPLFGLFLGLPALLILAVWLVGMDLFQAMVFAMVGTCLKFVLSMVLVGVLLGAAFAGAGM